MTTPASHAHLSAVSPWVARFAPLVKTGGHVLDVACGGGRHARYLAGRGFRVDAVDRDADALDRLAGIEGVAVKQADLEDEPWPYTDGMFDAVVVANYLHRPLFPLLTAGLAAGGVLIYETFARGNESYGKPSNPDFLLQPGELLALAGAGGLQVVAYEHGYIAVPKPAMVQRLAAIRPPVALAALAA
jgi:SAM-dependent methyltransferase